MSCVLQNIAHISILWFCLSDIFYRPTSLSDLKPVRNTVLPFSLFWLCFCHWSDVIRSQPSLSDPCSGWIKSFPRTQPFTAPSTQNFSCPPSTMSHCDEFCLIWMFCYLLWMCHLAVTCFFYFTAHMQMFPRGDVCVPCAAVAFPKQLLWKREQYHRLGKRSDHVFAKPRFCYDSMPTNHTSRLM